MSRTNFGRQTEGKEPIQSAEKEQGRERTKNRMKLELDVLRDKEEVHFGINGSY